MAVAETTPSATQLSNGVRRPGDRWQRRYVRKLHASDAVVVFATVYAAQWIRFGFDEAGLALHPLGVNLTVDYSLVSLVIALTWLIALKVSGTRDFHIAGTGSPEYRLVAATVLQVFGALAILSYLFKVELGRGYFLIALPLGLLALLISRWAWHQRLIRQRKQGRYLKRAVIIGEYRKAAHVIKQIIGDPEAGYEIVGALSDFKDDATAAIADQAYEFPWLPTTDTALSVVDGLSVDTVVYTHTDSFGPQELRQLGWELDERGIELVVAPALTDIAGPRIHTRPVAGLPLIHIEYPSLTGTKYWAKRIFDVAMSSVLIVLASPLLLATAIAVKLDSKGPVIFRQERVGMNGAPFEMLKFRSMVVDAEARLAALMESTDGNGVLFKMKHDPRITRVGAFIRKYSIDELPQLFNVVRGEMSLVGPRPPLAREVELYGDWDGRRLMVKPGITGLWQVSGRSDLSWDDSIRLDLYYVENWSLIGDIQLLYRTIRTVLSPSGAY